jgi:hypothetical protein
LLRLQLTTTMACTDCGTNPDCGCSSITLPYIVGDDGQDGLSAYQNWLQAGNTGTLADFIAALTGSNGQSAYEVAVANGFVGSEAAWLASLVGANGTNATNLFTNLVAFTVPNQNTSTIMVVGNTSWMVVGGWLYVRNAGYFRIVNVISPTQVQVANPGSVLGWPLGIPLQTAAGTPISTDSTATQVIHAAIPGIPGAAGDNGGPGPIGDPGPPAELLVVNTIPTLEPTPQSATRIYVDPGTGISYLLRWNGAVWAQQAVLTGAQGTQWIDGIDDPNISQPSAAIGTYYLNRTTSEIFQKTGVTTWTLRITLNALPFGLGSNTVTHDTPGTFNIDLGLPYTKVEADKAIELDYTSIPFNAQWVLEIENIDGGSINITYAAGKWTKKSGLTQPTTLASGAFVQFVFRPIDGDMTIVDIVSPVAL